MTRLHSTIAACALASLIGAAPLDAQTPGPEAAARRTAAGRVPIGATVNVRTADGQRFRAVLFRVDEDGVIVKPATRTPVASVRIPFDRLDSIERDEGGIHFGRYVGIGAAVGGAVLLFLLNGLGG
jgi:hypothetical protein